MMKKYALKIGPNSTLRGPTPLFTSIPTGMVNENQNN